MKWEDYSKMHVLDQQEFDYRFKRDRLEQPISLSSLVVLKAVILSELIVLSGMYLIPELTDLKVHAPLLLDLVFRLNGVIAIVVLVQVIVWIVYEIVYYYRVRKWLKKKGYKK